MQNKRYNRKNIRIKGYDYSKLGMYFITICTKNREEILSKIKLNNVGVGVLDDPKIELLEYGEISEKYIKNINEIYNDVKINDYVIMPNHIHMIIVITRGSSGTPTPTNRKIPRLISTYKRHINKESGFSVFQRNYYEHIIRNEKEYLKIKEYIENNPLKLSEDIYSNC